MPMKRVLTSVAGKMDLDVLLSYTSYAVLMISTTCVSPTEILLSDGTPSRDTPLAIFGIPSKLNPRVACTCGKMELCSARSGPTGPTTGSDWCKGRGCSNVWRKSDACAMGWEAPYSRAGA